MSRQRLQSAHIVRRYLGRELLSTLAGVTSVLLLILLSNKLGHYLKLAAGGKLSLTMVFKLIVLKFFYFLSALLPFSWYFAILLAYGRLWSDHEMTILLASGFSRYQLLTVTLRAALPISLVVAILTLGVGPYLAHYQRALAKQVGIHAVLDMVTPGRFQPLPGAGVVYVQRLSRDRNQMQQIFFARRKAIKEEKTTVFQWEIMTAEKGYQTTEPSTGRDFIVAMNGHRYEGIPGQRDFQIMDFARYGLAQTQGPLSSEWHEHALSARPTGEVWALAQQGHREDAAELHWRLALPFSLLILTVLAVPLSQLPPRRGRYAKIIPAALIGIFYLNTLLIGRYWVSHGRVPGVIGLWWVHAAFLLLAWVLWQGTRTGREAKQRGGQ